MTYHAEEMVAARAECLRLMRELDAAAAELLDLRSELAATRESRDEWERRADEVLRERDRLRESKRGLAELLDEWQGEAERTDGMLRRERAAYSASLERAEAVIDFWEAEVERARRGMVAYHTDRLAWDRWYADWYSALDATGIETAPMTQDGIPVPRMIWWHAHRRTR